MKVVKEEWIVRITDENGKILKEYKGKKKHKLNNRGYEKVFTANIKK